MVNKRKKIEKPRQEICMPLKWLCFLIGFFLFLIGIILTGLGVYLIVTDIRPLQDLIDIFINPSIFITIIGFFIIFVASCAFWGSLRESSYLLKVFSFAIFLSYISTVVFAFLLFYTFYTHPDDSTSAQSIMMYAIKNYNNNRNIAEFVDYIQEQFECCGASSISQGYKDWLLNEQFSCNSSNPYPEKCSVPFSCCRRSSNTVDDENVQTNKLVPAMASFHCWRDVQDKRVQDIESRINTFGCIYPLRQLFEKNAIYLGIIVSIIIMPVCLTICLSHLLAKQIDHQKYLLEREARRFERYKRKEARQRYNEHYAAVLQTYQLNEEDETTALPTNSSDSRKQPPSQQQLIKNQPKKSITSTGGYNKSSNNHKNAANSVEAIENKRLALLKMEHGKNDQNVNLKNFSKFSKNFEQSDIKMEHSGSDDYIEDRGETSNENSSKGSIDILSKNEFSEKSEELQEKLTTSIDNITTSNSSKTYFHGQEICYQFSPAYINRYKTCELCNGKLADPCFRCLGKNEDELNDCEMAEGILCYHVFHKCCVDNFLKTNEKCPTCPEEFLYTESSRIQ